MEYEPATLAQISKQREADMSIVTAKAKALEAVQQTIQIEEEGKAAAAKAKWEQEREKAVEVTKAQQAFEVAELQAKEAKEKAKKIVAEGEAEAAAARAKVQAGLTPLERAKIDMETKIGVAEALSKVQLPKVIMAGGTDKNGNAAMDAMGLKMLIDITEKMSK